MKKSKCFRTGFGLLSTAITMAALVASTAVSKAANSTYTYSGATGNWSGTANWTLAGGAGNTPAFPNALGDVVQRALSGNATVTQDNVGGVTVGRITHAGGGQFNVAPTQGIILNNDGTGAGFATISNTGAATASFSITSTGTLTLADNLAIINSGSSTIVGGAIQIGAAITGTGNITINNIANNAVVGTSSAGQIRITGANSFTGTTTIERGTVSFNQAAGFGTLSSNTIVLGSSGGGGVTLMATSSFAIANDLVVAAGTGGVTLFGSNSTGSGGTTGTVLLNQTLTTYAENTTTNAMTFSNVVSGTGGLIVTGVGNTRLTGVNTFTGNTRISNGLLQLGAAGVLTNSLALQNSTVDMNASDSGTLVFGTGVTTVIRSATLGGLTGSRNIALVNNNTTPASVALSIGNNNSSNTYSGTLSGSGSVIKVGTGTQTFTGVQTYTGSTAVTVGTLIVNGTLGSGGVTVSSGATLGGDITVGGTTSVAGTLAVGNSPGTGNFSTLNLQAGSTTETQFNAGATTRGTDYDAINVSTALTYSGTLKLVFLGSANNQTFDLFSFGALVPSSSFSSVALFANTTSIGTLTNNLGVWTGNYDLGFGGGTQTFTFTQSTGDLIVAVPEPSTTLLIGAGLVCMLYMVRRRRSSV